MDELGQFLSRHLTNKVASDKLQPLIQFLSQYLVLKKDYDALKKQSLTNQELEDKCEALEKKVEWLTNKLEEQLNINQSFMDHMRDQNDTIKEHMQEIKELKGIVEAAECPREEVNKKEMENISELETNVKTLETSLSAKDCDMQKMKEERELVIRRINRLKERLGLTMEASLNDLDKKVTEMANQDQKAMVKLKTELGKHKEKISMLDGKVKELELDKKYLKSQLRLKTQELARIRCVRETQRVLAESQYLSPRLQRSAPPGQNRKAMGRTQLSLVPVGDPEECVRCGNRRHIYCQECVRTVLYNGDK